VAQTMPPMILSSVLSRLILLRCQQKLFVFVVEVLVEMLVAAAALARVVFCVVLIVTTVVFIVGHLIILLLLFQTCQVVNLKHLFIVWFV